MELGASAECQTSIICIKWALRFVERCVFRGGGGEEEEEEESMGSTMSTSIGQHHVNLKGQRNIMGKKKIGSRQHSMYDDVTLCMMM